ncbi:Magnesium transporter MRS2-F [Asimina triloba]
MAEMYLTDKLAQRPLDETSSRDELDDDEFELTNERDEDSKSKCRSFNESSFLVKPEIQELEMLLEAYFVQVDGTLQKLSTMREYVDDAEDYINILLDDKQNQLLQMRVLLSTANMIFNAGIVVVAVTWDAYEATKNAHGVCILTEWDEFKALDYKRIYDNMQKPAFFFDGHNVLTWRS